MLNYFRETQEARFATRARRIYGYVSVGFVVAVGVLVIAGLAPVWTSWTILGVSCLLDAFLTRKWIREDALRAYRSDQAGCRRPRRWATGNALTAAATATAETK